MEISRLQPAFVLHRHRDWLSLGGGNRIRYVLQEREISQLFANARHGPKSITTAIGMSVSEELGGYVTLTVAVIVVTGIFGNIIAEAACKWFHITEPIAKGVAIGSSSHAIGTAKALEMGETEGAVSGLSIVVSGLFTVVFASIFAQFL